MKKLKVLETILTILSVVLAVVQASEGKGTNHSDKF